MATFKYYNLKVLPIANDAEEIGKDGYKELFEEYKKLIDLASSKRQFNTYSYPLRNEYRLIGLQILVRDDFSHGKFIKYHHSEALSNIYDGDVDQPIPPHLSAKIFEFEFAFDYENHVMAIEYQSLPSTNQFVKALEQQFELVAYDKFPDHSVVVNELTTNESLEEVLSADSYKSVWAEVSFTNSEVTEEELEEEFRSKGVNRTRIEQSAAKQHVMTSLTNYAKGCLNLAKANGDAKVIYYKGEKRINYQMKDKPVKITVKQRIKDSIETYKINIALSIKEAVQKTKRDE